MSAAAETLSSQVQPLAALADARESSPIVVVGMGPVGIYTVKELLKRGVKAPIAIYGDEPWRPYNRVRLSALLTGEADVESLYRDTALPFSSQVTPYFGLRVTAIDPKERRIQRQGEGWTPYSQLILALGSWAYVPDTIDKTLPGVFTFRDLNDAQRLSARQFRSRHTVVLGGGLLGLEAAKAMQRFNTQVTVVEAYDRLMARQLDAEGGEQLRDYITRLGIEVITNDVIVETVGGARLEAVRLRSNRLLSCDTLIVATGVRPHIELARAAGLSVGRGIRVDDAMTTSDPNIFAVGECAEHRDRVYGIVAPGLEQAAVLAHHLSGGERASYSGSLLATRLKVAGCPVFSAGEIDPPFNRFFGRPLRYRRPAEGLYRQLVLHRGRLVGAIAVGEWDQLGRLQEAVEQRRFLWPWQRWRFTREGTPWSAKEGGGVAQWPDSVLVCNCMGVTRGQLGQALHQGFNTPEGLAQCTGASTVCGSCRPLLMELTAAAPASSPAPKGASLLLAGGVIGSIAALAALLLPGMPFAESVQSNWSWDWLWRDDAAKQATGYSALAALLLGLWLSLRRRAPLPRLLAVGSFDLWRLVHVVLGVMGLIALALHTGGRLGDNLNAWLMLSFSLLILAGGALSAAIGWSHRLPPKRALALRRCSLWLHILAFWPLPVLLAFHIVKFYYY